MYKLFIGIFMMAFAYQNCGGNASFSNEGIGDELSAAEINSVLNQGDEGKDIDAIDKTCDNQTQIVKVIDINFPKPDKTCEWGKNGNLLERNSYFQARIEQKRNLNLPDGAIICDAEFAFEKQDFLYDDHFMLLFNKSVIASSYDFTEQFDAKNFGLLEYDWNKMVGMKWNTSKEMIFCPQIEGYGSECSFPGHDQQGTIDLAYDKRYIRGIMSNGVPTNHSFSLVSIGDDNKLDCEHSDVSFSVKVSYVK